MRARLGGRGGGSRPAGAGLAAIAAIGLLGAPARALPASSSLTSPSGTPQNQNLGTAFATFVVTVPCPQAGPVSVTFTAPSAGASGTFAGGGTSGVAPITCVANTPQNVSGPAFTANGVAGSYNVMASDDAGDSPANFALTNDGIAPVAGSPQTTRVGTAFPTLLQVAVFTGTPGNSAGSPAAGATVTFTAPSSGPTGVFSSTNTTTVSVTANSSGLASAPSFNADQTAGSYVVTATTGAVAGTASFSLTNSNAGVAGTISAFSGMEQAATVGAAYGSPLQAQVLDPNGNPVQGAAVTFSAPAGTNPGVTFAGGGSSATQPTGSNGVAVSPPLTANTVAGTFTVTASTPGVATPGSFPLDNLAGTPNAISTGSGSSQATPANTAFPVPLSVTVTDAQKNPVTGASVSFSAPGHGASGTFAGGGTTVTVATDSSGVAVAPTFTANATPGGYIVTASVTGVSSAAAFSLVNQAPGAASTGYWLVSSDGGVFSYGNAGFFGSAGALHLRAPIVGMASTPDGRGYRLVASDGGVFSYGNAGFFGSAGALHLRAPIVGMASTPDGRGYWLVASDGGVFTYGDARFAGSAGSLPLSAPITGMAAAPDGAGYWLVAADGGVFGYGSAGFHGSAASSGDRLVRALAAGPGGAGYWLADAAGIVYGYGDAPVPGSPAGSGTVLASPIVGMATPH
jgi:hypothetical protein